jgi:DNA-binding LytR/AlgR family response regulator
MINRSRIKTTIDKDNLVLLAEVKSIEQLQIGSIECIIADNIFTKVFFIDNRSLQLRKSLNEWESFLPKKLFVRVNRGVIINLNYVGEIEKSPHQTLIIHMQNYEKPVIMSRCYTTRLRGKLII